MYKVFCVVAGLVLFAPWWVLAQPHADGPPEPLEGMRDKFRPLLIFYPEISGETPADMTLQRQQALLSGRDRELKDRDVVVVVIPLPPDEDSANARMWAELRKKFQVDRRGFTVLLVGKDGGEKFRSHEPVTIEKLNDLIDAMPMRRQEVRDGHHPE